MERKRRRHWWAYILLFILSQLAAVGVTMLATALHGTQAATAGSTVVWALFAANVLAVVLFLVYRPQRITWRSTVAGLTGRRGRRTLLVFLAALPLIVLVNLGQEVFFPDIPDLVGEQTFRSIMYNPLGLLTVAVLGPLAEELLFRGGVQTDLYRSTADQGAWVAIALSAVIFSLIHMNPAQMPAAFILGCVLGFAYWWTGSLAASVCIHVFNNATACLLAYLSPDDDSFVHFLGGAQGAAATAVVSLFLLLIACRAVLREGLNSPEKG